MNGIKYRNPNEMKDNKYVWLGEVPQIYRMSSLRHILREAIVDGPHETPDYVDEGVPFISVDSLGDRVSVNLDIVNRFITEKKFKEYNRKTRLTPNDILFSKSATIGKVAIVDGRKFMTWSPLAIIKPDERKVLYKLLYYILSSNKYLYQVISLSNLNTQFNIGMKTLEKSKIILPYDLNEQQKIANFLDIKAAQFDSIIAKKELLIRKLEEAKKSLISEVVTGKVKIIDGEMVPRQPEEMKDSGVEWLGMIPMDWELKKLKYIMKINPVKSEIKRSNQLCSFVPMNKLHNGIIETDEDKRISDVYDGYTYFRDGDIIMAKVTPCFENGDIAIAVNLTNHIGFGTTEINVFRVSEVFDKKYIYYTLQENHFMCYGASHMTGVAGLKRIPTSYFANFMIAMPDFHEQQQLSAYIEGKIAIIRTISNKIRLEIQKIQQAKQSLISEAVTGKIDLRDWEITEVGEAQ